MAVAFDGATRRIMVTDVSSVDVQRDLYSAWKHWLILSDNAKYEQAFRSVGGDAIGNGQQSPVYFFLMNDWKIVVDGIVVDFSLNLYCEEETNTSTFPFIILNNGAVSYKVSDSPVVTTSGGSGLSAEQDELLSNIDTNTTNIPAAVWGTDDAMKLLEEHLGSAIVSSDGLRVTIRKRSDNSISHEFDISADKRSRTPV